MTNAKVKIKKAKVKMNKEKQVKAKLLLLPFTFCLFLLCVSVVNPCLAQNGGGYDLSHNVIASGGGSNSNGGGFTLDGTAGQPSAGTISTNSAYSLRGGFWAFQSLAPTASLVSVAGRVSTAEGMGIRNASVKLTGTDGAIRFAWTGTFGYFRFENVEVGEIYTLEVSSKRFTFASPTRVLSVKDEIADADFIAEPQ